MLRPFPLSETYTVVPTTVTARGGAISSRMLSSVGVPGTLTSSRTKSA